MFSKSYGLGDVHHQSKIFNELVKNGLNRVKELKTLINQPVYNKLAKTYLLADVERLTNVPRSSIRDKEKSGQLSYSLPKDGSLKNEYDLNDIRIILDFFEKGFFNGKVNRPKSLPPITIAVSMFKGGVGKTVHASHLAAHAAIIGLKVLLVDLDPQASATFMYGYIPSMDLNQGNTIFTTLLDDFSDIHRVIQKTSYSNLDIITSGLELQSADLLLPNSHANNASELGSPLLRLKRALQQIPDYDLIILDCAPNHGATTMNALVASNAVIIPVSPTMQAFGSSIQFLQTLEELALTLQDYLERLSDTNDRFNERSLIKDYINILFRILITNDPADAEAQDVTSAIRSLYGDLVLPRPMINTIALARASNDLGLLYDLKRSEVRGSKESFDRGISSMKAVNDDILTLIASIWGVSKGG